MWTKGKMKVIDDEGDCIFLEVDTPEANVTIAEIYTLGDNIDRAKGIANARRICHCVNTHEELVEALQALYDEQNGPPLLRDEIKEWGDAMILASQALTRAKKVE